MVFKLWDLVYALYRFIQKASLLSPLQMSEELGCGDLYELIHLVLPVQIFSCGAVDMTVS